jgi:ribosomal protein S18 acetylase RimI-like enzyme
MTGAQVSDFLEAILPSYVAERAAADHVSSEAADRYARAQYAQLLPDGHLTAGHHFLRMVAINSGQSVGGVWFWIDSENKQAFLYNITILPQYRRRGFASDALMLIEEIAREAGCATLGLNVFSSNSEAIALYSRVGFCPVSSYWNKAL